MNSKGKQPSNKITFNDLCELLDVNTLDDYILRQALVGDGCYHSNYTYAIEQEGKTEEEAELFAQEAEFQETAEMSNRYVAAVEQVAIKLFAEHNLDLTETKPNSLTYKIAPTVSWKDAADQIRETCNGVGWFHFSSLREFLDSGPWTPRQCTLEHLHIIADHPRVYGNGTAKSMVSRALDR